MFSTCADIYMINCLSDHKSFIFNSWYATCATTSALLSIGCFVLLDFCSTQLAVMLQASGAYQNEHFESHSVWECIILKEISSLMLLFW